MALTKENIIQKVHETADEPRGGSRRLVETALEIMKGTMQGGEDVLLSGFGKFMVKQKDARRGRNPQTNDEIQLRPRKVVVFRTSGRLREKINITV